MRALVAIVVLLAPAAARAYPQFQLSTDAQRCQNCHFSPGGGGLLTNYGRDEAGDTISMGGNGGFLHGAWKPPSWLQLGGDLRGAFLVNNVGATEGAGVHAFPMQADLYARFGSGPLTFYLNAGYRGSTRPDEPKVLSQLVSREHYLMFKPEGESWYVRAGRFFAPFGLRVAEHPAFIRRDLGFDLLMEPYALSGGWSSDAWELHVTAFTKDFFRPVGRLASGGAAYFEHRLGSQAAVGGQARVSIAPDDTQITLGAVGKWWLDCPRVILLAEVDVTHQSFANGAGGDRVQLVGYLGASWLPIRGLMISGTLERFDEDLTLPQTARSAVSLSVQWFFHAHFELSLYGRAQLIGSGPSDGSPSQHLLLQLHYYL